MASGQIEFGVSGAIQAMINWSSSSNGSVANSSTVTATIYCRRVDGYTTTGRSWSGYVRVGSAQSDIDFGSSVSVSNDWVEMTRVTTTIGHNNNGTGSVTISGSVSGPSGTSQSGSTSSGSFTATLDTIPRASSIDSFTTNTNYLDSTLTVKYTPKATFNHKLRVSIPGVIAIKTIDLGSQTAGQKTATTTFTSAELSTIYSRIGGSNDHCTIGCVIETYNGSTKIGESSELTKVLYMPTSIKPSINSVTVSEAVSGLNAKFGAFIQSKSKLSISISAAGVQGSTIKSYYSTVNGQSFSTASFTTDFLSSSGNITLNVTVTDTRNRTATYSRTISVLGYSKPTISLLTAVRNSSTDTTIDVKFSASITALGNKNDKSFKIKLGSTDKQTYTDAYSKTNQTYAITGASATSSFSVVLEVKDYFTTITETVLVGTAFAIQHISEDGKHIAFGQMYDSSKDVNVQIAESMSIGGCTITWNN